MTTAACAAVRRRRLRFDSSAGVVVAIDFGHEHICAGVGDLSGTPLADRSTAYDATTADRAPRLAADLAAAALAAVGLEPSAIVGAVVSLPGPVAVRDGEIAALAAAPDLGRRRARRWRCARRSASTSGSRTTRTWRRTPNTASAPAVRSTTWST